MLSTFKSVDIYISDLFLRWLKASIWFKDFHGMFNSLLNPDSREISHHHQKYSSYSMTTKHKPNTHYYSCNYICSFKMCCSTHFSSFITYSGLEKLFIRLDSAKARQPMNQARLWSSTCSGLQGNTKCYVSMLKDAQTTYLCNTSMAWEESGGLCCQIHPRI